MEETILNIIFTRFSDYSILYKLALVIILVIITLKIGFDERSPIKNNEFEKNPLKAENEVKLVSISKMNGTSVMINSIITGTFDLDFLFESTITINIPKLLINNTIKTNFSFSDLVK